MVNALYANVFTIPPYNNVHIDNVQQCTYNVQQQCTTMYILYIQQCTYCKPVRNGGNSTENDMFKAKIYNGLGSLVYPLSNSCDGENLNRFAVLNLSYVNLMLFIWK